MSSQSQSMSLDSEEQTAALHDLIAVKRRRLNVRQRQASFYGLSVDPVVLLEIEDLERELADLDRQLRGPGGAPAEPEKAAPGSLPKHLLGSWDVAGSDNAGLPLPELARPPESAGFVGRAAELAALTQQLATGHLAVIAGPAGVGKTAIAAELARRAGDPSRTFWHSFHEHEGIDAIIWKLAGFLAWNNQPELFRMLHTARQAGAQTPPPEVLFDFLMQNLRGHGYLVCLDDFQFVDEDPLVSHLGQRLRVAVQSGELALIVTSRHRPSFIRTIQVAPLAGLSAEDSRRLLEERELALASDLVAALHARTAGNPQLLTLAIDALRRTPNHARVIDQLSESSNIERYLMTEVDKRLSEDERAVMSALAALLGYPATRDAIEAVLDAGGARRTLNELASRYLLTVYEGEFGAEYAQHAIVQAFYYNLLGRRERQTMHLRAGNYYETEELDGLKAARHFERIGEHTHAARLATSNVEEQINQGQGRALLHLLASLPPQKLNPDVRLYVDETCGDVQYLLGELDAAVEHYTDAASAAVTAEPVAQARLHRKLGDVLARKARHDEALDQLARGRALLGGTGPAEERARLAVVDGTVLFKLGRYDEAAAEAQVALGLLPDESAHPRVAAELHELAGKVLFRKGGFGESIARFESALKLRTLAGDQQGIVRSQVSLGVVYGELGRYAEALRANKAALEVAERIGDTVALAPLYKNIAVDYMDQGKYSQAIEFFNRSLGLHKRMGNLSGLAGAYYNLGEAFRRQGQIDAAVDHLTKAIAFAEQAHDRAEIIDSLEALAEIYLVQGKLDDALSYCIESRRLAEEIGESNLRPSNSRLLGRIYHNLQQWDEARSAFDGACQLWREREMPRELIATLLDWSRQEADAGQLQRAYDLCVEATFLANQQKLDDLIEQISAQMAELEAA